MSEPWIRFYAADFRGDQKLIGMNADRRLALIHAYDIAKNGPGDPTELRGPRGAKLTESELRATADVSPERTRSLYADWAQRELCVIGDDGLVRFPKLVRRQGIDRGHAARQAAYRARQRQNGDGPGDGGVTAEVTPEVTGEVTPEFTGPEPGSDAPSDARVTAQIPEARRKTSGLATLAPAPSAEVESIDRQRRALFQALCDGSGIDVCEVSESERGKLNRAVTQLLGLDASPAMVADRCAAWPEVFPGATITPTGVVSNWARIGARPVEETARRRRDPDFEARLAAAKARR